MISDKDIRRHLAQALYDGLDGAGKGPELVAYVRKQAGYNVKGTRIARAAFYMAQRGEIDVENLSIPKLNFYMKTELYLTSKGKDIYNIK